jgi:MFS family permease
LNRSDVSIIAVTSSHGIMHAYLVLLPALIPLLGGELGNLAMLGLLSSLVVLFYGWGSLPVGFVADIVSKKTLMTLSMLLCGGSAILVSLSYSLPLTAVGMILLGVGASLYHPCGYSHMALCSPELRGRYMGIQGLGGDMGMALAYVTSAVLGVALGWRNTFLVWGVVGLLMALIDWLTIVDIPVGGAGVLGKREGYLKTIKKMFATDRRGTLFIVFLIIILSGALWTGVSTWILMYINRTKGVALLIAGGLSTLQYTVGAFAQIFGGELSDRIGRRVILLFGFGVFTASLVALTLAPGSLPILLVLVVLLGFTFFVTQAPVNALLGDLSHKDTVGVTYGINFTVKYGFGFFPPAVAGFIAQNYGMDYVFYFFAALSAAAFALTLLIREQRKA